MATNNFTRKTKAAACLMLMFMLEEGKNDVTRANRETKLESGSIVGRIKATSIIQSKSCTLKTLLVA